MMETEQIQWTVRCGWSRGPDEGLGASAQLVFAFGARSVLERREQLGELASAYPHAIIVGCSTAGEIIGTRVADDSLVATAIRFESTRVQKVCGAVEGRGASFDTGARLAASLDPEGLVHVFVISDGLEVNGSELVRGLVANLPLYVSVTGGLSGDGTDFEKTLIIDDNELSSGAVAILGFYGDRLRVGYGSLGGWDPFGPERLITRSDGNVLYELDGKSALELYKQYLGDHARELPSSGLLFPLSIRFAGDGEPLVRTILGVDEAHQSMTFAGDLPEGAYARFMKANFDRLIDGAVGAANTSYRALDSRQPDLAILISCVGRKLVLQQRVEEEVESVQEVLGAGVTLAGFYSYGEISPFRPSATCALHNQTMTITTLSEV